MLNRTIAYLLPFFPKRFIWLFSKKYIAGETIADAFRIVKNLAEQSVLSTIDLLGESVETREEVTLYQSRYLNSIAEIGKKDLAASFSLKPTMFGLLWDYEFCFKSIREIIVFASKKNIFIRIDMESSDCTSLEIQLFERLYHEFPANVGIVLQSYLHRTSIDLEYLRSINNKLNPINIRLCKGIYIEPAKIAFKSRPEIRDNFIRCLSQMLEYGFHPALATHDKKLINRSIKLIKHYNLSHKEYEFQMLLGVAPLLRQQLVENNHPIRVYVPYGEQWFNYSVRRLQENPKMVWDIISSLFVKR